METELIETYFAHEFLTTVLVAVIAAVILAVTPPPRGNAFAIVTTELGLRAFPIPILAHSLHFIAAIPAVVGEVAEPLLRHAPIVGAFEVHLGIALQTILGQLVGTVAAIVFPVTEQPFRYATVVGVAWTTLPTRRTILLATYVGWFVAVIATVVVGVTHPYFLDASAVLTGELSARIARPVVCVKGLIEDTFFEFQIII